MLKQKLVILDLINKYFLTIISNDALQAINRIKYYLHNFYNKLLFFLKYECN